MVPARTGEQSLWSAARTPLFPHDASAFCSTFRPSLSGPCSAFGPSADLTSSLWDKMGNLLGYPEDQPPVDPAFDRGATSTRSNGRPAIESMAVHVKEVLPQVPIDVIRKDLIVTANVDETITRLLDGTVAYQAEKKQASPVASVGTSSSSSSAQRSPIHSPPSGPSQPPLITAASCFGKTADERHRSFEERKQKLIEESKRRYLAKQEQLNTAAAAAASPASASESTN